MDYSWADFLNEAFETMRKNVGRRTKEERIEFNHNKVKTYLLIWIAMEKTYGINIGLPDFKEDYL